MNKDIIDITSKQLHKAGLQCTFCDYDFSFNDAITLHIKGIVREIKTIILLHNR